MSKQALQSSQVHPSWIQTNVGGKKQIDNRAGAVTIIDMAGEDGVEVLRALIEDRLVVEVVDEFKDQVDELYLCRQPAHKFMYGGAEKSPGYADFIKDLFGEDLPWWRSGCWVYYPWSGRLVHVLDEELFRELRSARNKSLIAEADQVALDGLRVAVAGLSIGQSLVQVLSLLATCRTIHVADFDELSLSNTNRIPGVSIGDVGVPKTVLASRLLLSYNPYVDIKTFDRGLEESSLEAFATGVDVIVDEVDDFRAKIRLREVAKEKSLPVLMAADVGEAAVMTVERFDEDDQLLAFNGNLSAEDIERIKTSPPSLELLIEAFVKVVGEKYMTEEVWACLPLLGKELAGPPQLGSTALLSGIVLSRGLRLLASRQPLPSGRVVVDIKAAVAAGSAL